MIEHPSAAHLDIGATEIYLAVPHDPESRPVRRLGTFTDVLEQMAEWLERCGVTTRAMESTVSLAFRHTNCSTGAACSRALVTARHSTNMPGRGRFNEAARPRV